MSALKKAGRLSLELLREFSNQNACQRYLAARGATHSAEVAVLDARFGRPC